jgi:hypothetical protein
MTTPAAFWYCTGRGGHDRADLPAVVNRPVPGKHSFAFVGPCPVCGLGPRKITWKVWKIIAAARLTEVDISVLPFYAR